jgi:hypothetical protein
MWSGTPVIPVMAVSINRKMVQAGLSKMEDSISKITRAKRAENVT